jgi:HEAT repeat protein
VKFIRNILKKLPINKVTGKIMAQGQNINQKKMDQEEATVLLVAEPSYLSPRRGSSAKKVSIEDSWEKKNLADPHIREFRQIASSHWDDNRAVIRSYIHDLEKRNDEKARELLAQALKKGAPYTQRLVCTALRKMGKMGIELLVEHLIQADGQIRSDAYQALHSFGSRGVSKILDILQGNSEFELTLHHRAALIQIIADHRSTKVSAFLSGYLVSLHSVLRKAATHALKKQGKYAEKVLIKLLDSLPKGHSCQKTCIYLLGHMGSKRASPLILKIFCKERNPYRLSLEAWALGQMGVREAIAPLFFVLEEMNHFWLVQRSIIRALGNIGSQEAVDGITPYLDHQELREATIEALGKIGGTQAREAIAPFMQSSVHYLRYLTVTALFRMGDKEAIRVMLEGLLDEDPLVRNYTEKAFAKMYSEEELDEIYENLEQEIQREQRLSSWKQLLKIEPTPISQEYSEDFYPEEPALVDPESLKDPYAKPLTDLYSGKGITKDFPLSYPQRKQGFLDKIRQKAEKKFNEFADRLISEQMNGNESQQNPYPFGAYYDPQQKTYRR